MLFFEIYMFKFLERKQEKVVFIRVPTVPPKKKECAIFRHGDSFSSVIS